MMQPDESSQDSPALALVDPTLKAFDQGQAASPQEGMELMTRWFDVLGKDGRTTALNEPLQALYDHLQSGSLSNTKLVDLLHQLADETEEVDTSDEHLKSRLTTLATALRNFAGQLSTAV